MAQKSKKHIAILASGNGSNLEAILKQVRMRNLPAEVAFCFSDNPNAFALERARKLGFQTIQFSPKDFPDRDSYEAKLTDQLNQHKVDFVILAGYMRLLGPAFVKYFSNRIINIHPALLPSFKGVHGIRDAWEYGVRYTGITVHFVNEDMDAGPVIAQAVVPVLAKESLESLEKRIHRVEHQLYPDTIKKVLTKKHKIVGRKMIFQ